MSQQTNEPKPAAEAQAPKRGFFARLLNKLDASMKQKAETQAKQGSCCGGNSKGGKCC